MWKWNNETDVCNFYCRCAFFLTTFSFFNWKMGWVPKMVGFPPKSSILIGFSIINHPFWGYHPLFLETPKSTLYEIWCFTSPFRGRSDEEGEVHLRSSWATWKNDVWWDVYVAKTTLGNNMGVSENRVFSLQTIQFHKVFHSKPSILGYPHFWKHPYLEPKKSSQQWRSDWSGTLQKPKLQCTEMVMLLYVPYFEGMSFLFWCSMEEWNTRLQNRDGEFSYELEVYPVTKSEKTPRLSEERSEENHANFSLAGRWTICFEKISSWHRNSSTGWCFPIHLGVGVLHQPVSNTPKIYTSKCRIHHEVWQFLENLHMGFLPLPFWYSRPSKLVALAGRLPCVLFISGRVSGGFSLHMLHLME